MGNKSPYLKNNRRLADVITAIQVMSTYSTYTSRTIEKWETRLGKPASCETWEEVIEDHPEFFRKRKGDSEEEGIETIMVSLNWRWSRDRDYSPLLHRCLTDDELKEQNKLPKTERLRITKMPLSTKEVEILIKTAISLQESAINHKKEKRWSFELLAPAAIALIGTLVGAILASAASIISAFLKN